jgi:parallel beta-helix repeat protein
MKRTLLLGIVILAMILPVARADLIATCLGLPVLVSSTLIADLPAVGTCLTIGADNVELNCAGFSINGDQTGTAIIAQAQNNVTVKNCNIDTFSTFVDFTGTNNSIITNNTLGTAELYGVITNYSKNIIIISNRINSSDTLLYHIIADHSTNITIENNRINATQGRGIELQTTTYSRVQNNTVNNTFDGIIIENDADNNTVANNTIRAYSTGLGLGAADQNLVINNNALGESGFGISIASLSAINQIINNTAHSVNQSGFVLFTAVNNTLINNKGITDSIGGNRLGFAFLAASNNTVINTTVTAPIFGISIAGSNNRVFNTVINAGSGIFWGANSQNTSFTNTTFNRINATFFFTGAAATSKNNSFTDTLFNFSAGSVRIIGNATFANAVNISASSLVTSQNMVTTSAPLQLNQSAEITLRNINFLNPQTMVDLTDNGTFVACPSEICGQARYANGEYTFTVQHFTSFTSSEGNLQITLSKTDSPDPVAPGATLNYIIVVNVTSMNASNITLTDIYPPQIIFGSAQPSPITGTNNTFIIGNLTNGTAFTVNITVTVRSDTPTGININNTANISYQNQSGASFTANVTEDTTIGSSLGSTAGNGGPDGANVSVGKPQTKNNSAPSSVIAAGGNITEVNITATTQTQAWQGFWGDVNGTLVLQDAAAATFYAWTIINISGEVYASRDNAIVFSTIAPNNNCSIDNSLTQFNKADSENNTFTNNSNRFIQVGSVAINASTACAVYTYVNGAPQTSFFQTIILTDDLNNATAGGNTSVYAAPIDKNQSGYNNDAHDYQLLVPVDKSVGISTYYFYAELG